MISIQELHFSYPGSQFTLQVDEWNVKDREKVAIVGPSGSGKTTLLNLISGIHPAGRGSILVAGETVSTMNDTARRAFRIQNIGFVFQQFELVEYLNVRENIQLPYWINQSLTLSAEVRQRAVTLAERVGIADKLNRPVTQLSQGERQRVAICRALLTRPKLILADEPTGNLDPTNKQKILELIFQQCQDEELTLVAVTHDVNILDGFDRTIDFEQFRKVESELAEAPV